MFSALRDVFRLPDLKSRILFVLGILLVFRLGAHIPTPGVDAKAMASLFEQGGVLNLFDLFAGGALRRFSIFALGVTPYINASIVMQLLAVVIPAVEKMQKEGEEGRRKIVQYTRISTILFSAIQAVGMVLWLRSMNVIYVGGISVFVAIVTLVAGSIAVMWLGEMISDHGIGNGISLLIFAGIVARIPESITRTFKLLRTGELNLITLLLALIIMVIVIAGCILLQEGQRRLPVQYAKRVVGTKVYGGQTTFIPLRVNSAGVIPIIFASSVLLFPSTIARFFSGGFAQAISKLLSPSSPLYMVLYVLLIIFFTYFYTAVVFNPADVANNLKKYGGFIPGIRPGRPTADYIEKVLSRVTLGGAVFLAAIAILPSLLTQMLGITTFYFGGTAVLIVVGVALETVQQIEAQLLMRHYEGLVRRKGKAGGILRL
ncbi:MAG TPA: preprotein translocase subunit SecY [Acetomicrobium flavidum]|uniref:Protein translocase subunit SecY n=2 Tax=Acetomicrobium TaxID=49894 RepID=I4BV41_ACEMN|nr:preprotein translocase subunit SecY [Acetomicrobium mobile]AFM21148.1 protein translocase subunit secY/sec61 alpha [Acetomicrobium mobile DSM 13181]SIN64493.1 protein translocase subunit secY/sec61 alpha [Acetomicrobium flavidum]HPP14392.1 preprotein translocase subunit SecY [Acetomicrobium flavidum]HPU69047.1 preprotein translocase subunit SecY [Acetomicrobium flavidum]